MESRSPIKSRLFKHAHNVCSVSILKSKRSTWLSVTRFVCLSFVLSNFGVSNTHLIVITECGKGQAVNTFLFAQKCWSASAEYACFCKYFISKLSAKCQICAWVGEIFGKTLSCLTILWARSMRHFQAKARNAFSRYSIIVKVGPFMSSKSTYDAKETKKKLIIFFLQNF